jgi:hypothetical protein
MSRSWVYQGYFGSFDTFIFMSGKIIIKELETLVLPPPSPSHSNLWSVCYLSFPNSWPRSESHAWLID